MESQYVVFKLGNEFYGLGIGEVERILPEQKVTKVPRAPKAMLGVFDLRGETIAAMDLRTRFDMKPLDEEGNFVVINTPEGRCAIKVDGLDGILNFSEDQISKQTDFLKKGDDQFIYGIGKCDDKLVLLLEASDLLPKAVKKEVLKIAS